MKLGCTIICVPDVASSLGFFTHAFGLEQRFLRESGDYGELETGETTLAFASHALGAMNFPDGHVRASDSKEPLGMEIALVTEDVPVRIGRPWSRVPPSSRRRRRSRGVSLNVVRPRSRGSFAVALEYAPSPLDQHLRPVPP